MVVPKNKKSLIFIFFELRLCRESSMKSGDPRFCYQIKDLDKIGTQVFLVPPLLYRGVV